MQLTSQFVFDEDYGQFISGPTYVLAGHDRPNDRVAIVEIGGPDNAQLLMWDRQAFEGAYSPDSGTAVISLCEPQRALPEWLAEYEGCTAAKIDAMRSKNSPRKHVDCIQERLAVISAIGEKLPSIFEQADWQKQLNREIRLEGKRLGRNLNVTRVRSQLLIWYAFGKQEMALFPAYTRCGSKAIVDSDEPPVGAAKRGRPATRGKRAGYNVDKPMLEKMEIGYRRHREKGTPVTVIYRRTLDSEFHCKVDKVVRKRPRLVQPDGKPFPSESQFRYHMGKIFSQKEVRTGIYGATKIRRTESASCGAYSDGVSYFGERTEFDAQIKDEHPVSFDGVHVLEKLHTTSSIDVATGVIMGIGGGLGAEDSASHQAMAFCEAIDKVKFCDLFGIYIEPDEWRSKGIPPMRFGDRGPGMSEKFSTKENALLRIFGRSYQGQDKPTIENSHEKSINIEGQPVPKFAKCNPVELFRKDIFRALAHNNGADMSSRLTPEMVRHNVIPTPNGIHDFLISRGRSLVTQIPFEEAVRRYLTPIEVTISPDAVYFNKLRFNSPEMHASGLLDYAKNHDSFPMSAFILELCASTIWVVAANGALIEVKFKPALMEDAHFIPLTHADTQLFAERFMNLQAQQTEVSQAVKTGYEQQIKELEDIASTRNQPIPIKPGVVSKNATEKARRATGS